MTPLAPRAVARRTLALVLTSGIVGWALFVAAGYSDLLVESGLTFDELYGPDAVGAVRPSKYLIFAAIAVVALTAVWGKRRMRTQLAAPEGASRLTPATEACAGSVIIITLVLSAMMALSVFLSSFFEGSSGMAVTARIFDTYLPIVLFTALAVAVLLAGFVFMPRMPEPARVDHPAPERVADAVSQRSTALSFTVPIVAVAAALIFGLIVYDLTQRALPVWIWVIVQLGVGAGIVAGTIYAAKAADAIRAAGGQPAGTSVGAKNLNLVLSIIFAAAVALMSLGYGSAAIAQLRSQPSLALSAYPGKFDANVPGEPLPVDEITLDANGGDLARGSEAVLRLQPGGSAVASQTVDPDGFLWLTGELPGDLEPGDYTLELQAEARGGEPLLLELALTVGDDGTAMVTGPSSTSIDSERATALSPSLRWVTDDLLPPFAMILLAAGTLFVTLTVRNRDAE